LEKLGFPWILSSESSLFKGLRGKFGIVFFVAPPPQRAFGFGTPFSLSEGFGHTVLALTAISRS
jgi:hypothetical protein